MRRRVLLLVGCALLVLTACRPIVRPSTLPAAPGGNGAASLQVDNDCDAGTATPPITFDGPDPSVLTVPDSASPTGVTYYLFTTANSFVTVPVYRSTDLVSWKPAGADDPTPDGCPNAEAMPTRAPWTDWGCNWAPSVLDTGATNPDPATRFVMYYTAATVGHGLGVNCSMQCIGIAFSAAPDGPYVDARSAPAICQTGRGGSIDPSPFTDLNGNLWLTFKSEDLNLWTAPLSAYGRIAGKPYRLALSTYGAPSWERPRIEGPTMVPAPNGVYYLLYSAGAWENSSYKVAAARCSGPAGPCSRTYSTPTLGTRWSMQGPGGQTPFRDASGRWRVIFHAWQSPRIGYTPDPATTGQRSPRLLSLYFDGPGGNPRISA